MAERALTAKTTDIKRDISASRVQKAEHSQSAGSQVERILFLQRTIGNQVVSKLIKSGALQAKLRIGAPGDIYEQEADRVAEQVMRMPELQFSDPDRDVNMKVKLKTSPNTVMPSCDPCRSDWETIVDSDHDRALNMLDTAISKLASYDGTSPADVKDALERRFKASSNAFATWINLNLRYLRVLAPLAGYQCQKSDCGICNVPNRYGWSAWCVPFTDIRVCDPVYFAMNNRMRSMGLIHEWVHKYGCNFDFGYCSGSDCPGGTTRSLFNADPWAKLVLDIS
ncbi:hypothetical protein ANME2D_02560 [Candidatus Methanoperedens nitroreducens]|uniref:Lysine-specific metallo-endopeptidase domain-containing protein n=1 Tax=Candidatus Methanoperedens nitratireducens TaxID=1392998 RepID=A0A062V562_9EURY|nr:hypothetical protein [Candidatus Methanoperedens nitroreducens]KCZ70540.1 hypothetical protein ANME2D_02560 [Candidatus Methanoperedens nitroreducens]MDJ1420392.1 hypothetical protein [Candidatus Methanoperedens sp.]